MTRASQANKQTLNNYWVLKKFNRNLRRSSLLGEELKDTEFANKVKLDINGIHMEPDDYTQAKKELNQKQLKRLRQCLVYSL